MTIIEWDDVPIVRQLARENVGALRASDEGWAQALADAAVSLTQVERDVLLMDAASNRHPTEKRVEDDEVPARSHALESAQTDIHALMRLRGAQLAQASETLHAWEFEHALPSAETSEPDRARAFEDASTFERRFNPEDESAVVREWTMSREIRSERTSQMEDSTARMVALELQHESNLARVLAEQIRSRDAHDAMRESEEHSRREADATRTAWMPSEMRFAAHEAEQTTPRPAAVSSARHVHASEAEPARHAAPTNHRGEHAPHPMRSLHAARIVHAAHSSHSSQAARVMALGDAEGISRTAGNDDAPAALGAGGSASTGATAAPTHKRGEPINGALAWIEGQQPVRTPRGAIAIGSTARSLLASMRRVSSDDNASLRGLALPRGARAGGPLLRRVTHAYLGRDGVTLWVRDAKMSAQNASALLSALHRWASVAGIKIAAVICNGKMIYRAARLTDADVTTRAMEKKEKNA